MIQVKNLSKLFGKKNVALDEVSFSIEKGEVFGIIGESGAGKSTLMRVLSTLEEPTSGSYIYPGKSQKEFRAQFGKIFQHFNLLASRTAIENVQLPLEFEGKALMDRAHDLLKRVGLEDRMDAYPAQLSGGEKQRVAIARALVRNPELLFCDECTSALDAKATDEILELLDSINREMGVTIVLITHEMDVLRKICDRAIILEKGRIVEGGSISQLFSRPQSALGKRLVQGLFPQVDRSLNGRILHLCFEGSSAEKPVISEMVRTCAVEANILHGRIDRLKDTTIGNLLIELTGEPQSCDEAIAFLKERTASCEEVYS